MRMKCNQCQSEMIEECKVNIQGRIYRMKISKKAKRLFDNVSVKPKAVGCPNCDYVAFYMNE